MRIIEHAGDAACAPPARRDPAARIVEVTPAMLWAALEEWAGFDDARDDLGRFLAGVYRAMETARRDTAPLRVPATVTYIDLRRLP